MVQRTGFDPLADTARPCHRPQRGCSLRGVTPIWESESVRLVSFRVRVYKNFVDSGEVEADPEVTVLVGKNESGKTTLLDALWRLRPANATPRDFDITQDYSRWLMKDHEIAETIGDEPPISAVFALDPDEVTEVEKAFGSGILPDGRFIVERFYDDDDVAITVEVDPNAWVKAISTNRPLIWPAGSRVESVEQLVADIKAFGAAIEAAEDKTAPDVVARQKALDGVKAYVSTPHGKAVEESPRVAHEEASYVLLL